MRLLSWHEYADLPDTEHFQYRESINPESNGCLNCGVQKARGNKKSGPTARELAARAGRGPTRLRRQHRAWGRGRGWKSSLRRAVRLRTAGETPPQTHVCGAPAPPPPALVTFTPKLCSSAELQTVNVPRHKQLKLNGA